MPVPFSPFNLRIATSGPTILGQNDNDVIAWNATLQGWQVQPGGGAQGPQGAQGAAGGTGTQGPQGAQGAPGGECPAVDGVPVGGPPATSMTFTFDLTAMIAGLPNPTSHVGARMNATIQHNGGEGNAFGSVILPVTLIFAAGALTGAISQTGLHGTTQSTNWIGSMGTDNEVAGTEDAGSGGQWVASVGSATSLVLTWTPFDTEPIGGRAELCIGPQRATI